MVQIAVCGGDDQDFYDSVNCINAFFKIRGISVETVRFNQPADFVTYLRSFVPYIAFIYLDEDKGYVYGYEFSDAIVLKCYATNIVFISKSSEIDVAAANYMPCGFIFSESLSKEMDNTLLRILRRQTRCNNFFCVSKRDGIRQLRYNDIVYFESEGKVVTVNTVGEEFVFRGKLDEVACKLANKGFIRVHQSYLINVMYVSYVSKKELFVELFNGQRVPISKRRLNEICLWFEL